MAEVSVPKATYGATDAEWRQLPEGERIVHVFTVASSGMPAQSWGPEIPLWVLIESVYDEE